MQTTTSNGYTIQYPDKWCMAFNPQYVSVEKAGSTSEITVTVDTRSIKAASYDGKARIYIAELLRLVFDTPETTRYKSVTLAVKAGTTTILNTSLGVFWGSIDVRDRFFGFGDYKYRGDNGYKASFERDIVWFKNFPFTVNVFRPGTSDSVMGTRQDGAIKSIAVTDIYSKTTGLLEVRPETIFPEAKYNARYDVNWTNDNKDALQTMFKYTLNESSLPDPFDSTFDNTFHPDASKRLGLDFHINLEIRDDKRGYYLRWIDRFGYVQYFLFDPGQEAYKTNNSSEEINIRTTLDGVDYARTRSIEVTTERTVKVCAVNLRRSHLPYVMSIVSSPCVDMFVGSKNRDQGVWMPVKVVSGSHTHEIKPEIYDLEITLELPNIYTQKL